MLTNENGRKTKRLSREILGLLLITAVIALFFWGFLYLTANSISETYFTERNLQPSEGQWLTLRAWIRSVSLLSTVILFLVLFLFLLGQKLAYLREIIQGVDALRTHRLEDTIPLREANELTELAEHINFLSETERRLRQQETALQAERERMIRDLSHDIRTPLNGIFGLLKINEMHSDDVELLRSNHEKMMVSAKHLLSLINDMLQMSKLEDGEYVLSREWVDLNELLRDVLTIVSQRAAEVGVTMTYDRNADWVVYPYIYASPLHVRQLFLNIYGNCIKYNHVGGRVDTVLDCMGVENGKVTYRWTISDTGVGTSEDFLQHIFEPFAQENSDARSVYQGTGLGMAIAKSLADKMDGDIRVTSEKGKGSVFVVTLAFEIAEEKRSEETSAAADVAGLRLLLAEDNELNAEIAERLLSDEGARIAVVRDGQKAVETFRDQPPGTFDAILMDVMLPVMDGLSATRAIREMDRPDAKTIPIIAMTASAFEEDAQRCMKAGMNAHIPKPLQMERVLTTIAKCCRH